ncbi:MAG: hypothetical protein JO347_04245, partial [Candidatus Eremiobacteraeota bacterium]|nr:hypothetical protein [Candidatus Eremiobacteraeota bacterium]
SVAMLEALQRGDFSGVQSLLQNDFHDLLVARTPQIAAAVAALDAAGATNALLAGSGSCVFTLATEQHAIEALAARLDLPANYDRFVTAFAATPQWKR